MKELLFAQGGEPKNGESGRIGCLPEEPLHALWQLA